MAETINENNNLNLSNPPDTTSNPIAKFDNNNNNVNESKIDLPSSAGALLESSLPLDSGTTVHFPPVVAKEADPPKELNATIAVNNPANNPSETNSNAAPQNQNFQPPAAGNPPSHPQNLPPHFPMNMFPGQFQQQFVAPEGFPSGTPFSHFFPTVQRYPYYAFMPGYGFPHFPQQQTHQNNAAQFPTINSPYIQQQQNPQGNPELQNQQISIEPIAVTENNTATGTGENEPSSENNENENSENQIEKVKPQILRPKPIKMESAPPVTTQEIISTTSMNTPPTSATSEASGSRLWKTTFRIPTLPASEFEVDLECKTRCERYADTVPDKIYSSLKYELLQKGCGALCTRTTPVISVIRVVFSDTGNEVKNTNGQQILAGSVEVALSKGTSTKIKDDQLQGTTKIQFSDVSYHYKKSSFAWEISYYLPNDLSNPIMKKRSPSFKVFARKPKDHKSKSQESKESSQTTPSSSKKRKIEVSPPKTNVTAETETPEEKEMVIVEQPKSKKQKILSSIQNNNLINNSAIINNNNSEIITDENKNYSLDKFEKLLEELKLSLEKIPKDELPKAKALLDSKISPFFNSSEEEKK